MKVSRENIRAWIVKKSFELPQIRGIHRLAVSIGKILTSDDNYVAYGTLNNGFLIKLNLKSPDQRTLFYLRSYEQDLIEYFRSILKVDNPVFIDVGASIGVFTLSIADVIVENNGRIIAFEPFEENYNYLAESISLNRLQDTVTLHRKAVGHEKRIVEMRIAESSSNVGNALMREVDQQDILNYQLCEMVLMDEVLEQEQLRTITAVKIDVEGWEYFAIMGFLKMIEKFRPVIYGEFLGPGMKAAGITTEMLRELIDSIGYSPHFIDQSKLVPLVELPNQFRLDLILIPKERVS